MNPASHIDFCLFLCNLIYFILVALSLGLTYTEEKMLKYEWYGYSVFVQEKIKLQWLLKTLCVIGKTNRKFWRERQEVL